MNLKYVLLLLSYFLNYVLSIYKFETSFNNINESLNFFNETEISEICNEAEYVLCYTKSLYYINKLQFADRNSFEENQMSKVIFYNKFLSNLYFYVGEIEYFGLITNKPNLLEGFRKLLIAAYYGNPGALYKMYILLESNVINSIFSINGFEYMLTEKDSLQSFIYNSTFYENFKFEDEYSKKNSAFNFLYASSISKYNPAITTLAYKYLKGNRICHKFFFIC